jgi:predicted nucleic acid-binding protein
LSDKGNECVWSQALRHKSPVPAIAERLKELIKDGRVVMIGPMRQELLSGISDIAQFNRLKDIISSFEDLTIETGHYIKAAEFSNICRNKGVRGSTIDFLICAVAKAENLAIFSTDRDFENFRKHLPVKLLK